MVTSYMYNPSQKVTDLLSEFLEFDPEQLELGIWSGDLSLKNIHLKKDAIHPLLNQRLLKEALLRQHTTTNTSMNEESKGHKKPPLAMRLVSGTIGNLRLQIPWKRLVWGQGSVHVEISDVMIVLSMQSREETERETKRLLRKKEEKRRKKQTQDVDVTDRDKTKRKRPSSLYSQAYRDAKQKRLREAERRQLTGQPIATWLENLHQKQTIAKEARKVLQGGNRDTQHGSDQKGNVKEGRMDRYLKTFSSDLFWRFFAGVEGSIKKARIVLVQDGVEVGCIVQSVDVIAGTDGFKINLAQDSPSIHTPSARRSNDETFITTPHGYTHDTTTAESPHPTAYESGYDDGEHVDKTLKQQGLGIFVRKEANLAKIPQALRFSNSVGADDYILRPVGIDVSFSFFYPYPPEKRQGKKVTMEPETDLAAVDSGRSVAASTATTDTRRRRRGKREKTTTNTGGGNVIYTQDLKGEEGEDAVRSAMDEEMSKPYPLATIRSGELKRMASIGPGVGISTHTRDTAQLTTSTGTIASAANSRFGHRLSPPPPPPSTTTTTTGRRRSMSPTRGTPGPRRGVRPHRSADKTNPLPNASDHSLDVSDILNATPLRMSARALSAGSGTNFGNSMASVDTPSMRRSHRRLASRGNPQQTGGAVVMGAADGSSAAGLSATPSRFSATPTRPRAGQMNRARSAPVVPGQTSVTGGNFVNEYASAMESPTAVPALQEAGGEPVPKLECNIRMDEIKVVFTTRHYELLSFFFSTVTRMKNGRPDKTIRSVKETEPGTEFRKLMTTMLDTQSPSDPLSPTSTSRPTLNSSSIDAVGNSQTPSRSRKTTISGRITSLWSSSKPEEESEANPVPSPSPAERLRMELSSNGIKSARQEAIAKWWKYAVGAIIWELRKRKHMTSAFREMYMSFQWSKQRHRRKEYIELYIAHKLDKGSKKSKIPLAGAVSNGMRWPFEDEDARQGAAEEKLLEIEDALPMEQILLYRSIARRMRVHGTTKMPDTVLELLSHENRLKLQMLQGMSKAPGMGESGHKEVVEDPAKVPDTLVGQDSSILGLLQIKFDDMKRLRDKGGVLERFVAAAERGRNGGANGDGTGSEANLSTEAVPVTEAAHSPGLYDRKSALDTSENRHSSRHRRQGTMSTELKAGTFYSSGGTKKDGYAGDGRTFGGERTLRSARYPQSKHTRQAASQALPKKSGAATSVIDNRLRLYFSCQIQAFELVVVEEEYHFELAPDVAAPRSGRLFSPNASKRSGFGDANDSSSDDVSDLSVLTDDQRFFSEQISIGVIAEEEEDDEGGAKLSSTDFLAFGQPENPLLHLTVSSFLTTAKGVSGGGMQVGVSVGHIKALGDQSEHILSIGPSGSPDPALPMTEVNIDGSFSKRQRSFDGSSNDGSTFISGIAQKMLEEMMFTRISTRIPQRAISLRYSKDSDVKVLQCDVSRIVASANVVPAGKLLQFYSKPETRHPERLLMKSSRDVARKIMVQKLKSSPTHALANIDFAIRIHGVEVRVPFNFNDTSASEASELESIQESCHNPLSTVNDLNHSVTFETDALEFYSGRAVDELITSSQVIADEKDVSVFSGSLASSRRHTVIRAMQMLDLAELTAAHDSFASKHFVVSVGSIQGNVCSRSGILARLVDVPIDAEVLITSNVTSLLDTVSPKQQVVVEVSPVNILLSEQRLEMLSAAKLALDFGKVDAQTHIKKAPKPDPPRIEILSQRILSSVDIKCRRVRLELYKDIIDKADEILTAQQKEMIMEECLTDFLSIVSCFDFNLPNEEALSSAMQVCIGRLVGLGLSDDEAWGCTNAARLNLLDDIALMRQAQSDVLAEMIERAHQVPTPADTSFSESEREDASLTSDEGILKPQAEGNDAGPYSVYSHDSNEFSDDDTQNSGDIVETTISNAVEKTIATFASLFVDTYADYAKKEIPFLVLDLPMGTKLSIIKMFYDSHMTFCIANLVLTNKAGIELLTLVPHAHESVMSDGMNFDGHGLLFSRFSLDKDFGFGQGGLPMAVLATNQGAEMDLPSREKARFDDIEVGELEFLFSAQIYEEIIDELLLLSSATNIDKGKIESSSSKRNNAQSLLTASNVMMASSLSLLFASDTLVPFCRLTLECVSYKNDKALDSLQIPDKPSWALVAKSFSLQNLCPEGQYYPDVLGAISPADTNDFPFQLRFFKSPDHWKVSNRLEIDFSGFRLFLYRQFIHELLQFFLYEHYGVGKLKKKYTTDVTDIYGNSKPPLLYTVYLYDTSLICPRRSGSSDMVAFEVEDACIAVSYIEESFQMPTECTVFVADPQAQKMEKEHSRNGLSNAMSSMSLSDYEDAESDISETGSDGPISSHSSNLKRRLKINLDSFRVFTALSKNKGTKDIIESSLFRYFNEVIGRAEDGKPVYHQLEKANGYFGGKETHDFDSVVQSWEEITTKTLNLEVLADWAPHMRLLIADHNGPDFMLDARLSQLCLLLSVWDNNMQEMPVMFPFQKEQVVESASPPAIPENFPGYGSEEFVSFLANFDPMRSEICCIFKKVIVRCSYDDPGFFSEDPGCFQYFEDPYCPQHEKPGVTVALDDAVIHVLNNSFNVRRIAIGSSGLSLVDERRPHVFQQVLTTTRVLDDDDLDAQVIFADLQFGLHQDIRTLGSSLPQPVQFSVFMTPGWSMINIGAEKANGVMHDLSWIWCLLDYFKSYYTNAAFGNPGLLAQRWAHRIKNAVRKARDESMQPFEPLPGVKVDFRVWLCQPKLCLPSDYHDPQAPVLHITSETGVWYRYKSIQTMSSQEVISTDLNLFFDNEFQTPEHHFSRQGTGNSSSRPIIEGLSFGLRYDCNNCCNHKDVSVIMPFSGPNLAVTCEELEVDPVLLPSPTVLKPFQSPHRDLGLKVCDITCIFEVLPLTSATMMNFFKGPTEVNEEFTPMDLDQGSPTYSVSASVDDVRFFAIDPDLGVQLPVAVVSLSKTSLTMTKFSNERISDLQPGDYNPENLQIVVMSHLWADYFKLGLTRSWEPLLEPVKFEILHENSQERGTGTLVDSDSPLTVTLSGSLLQVLNDTLKSFGALIKETFGGNDTRTATLGQSVVLHSPTQHRVGALVEDSLKTVDGHEINVVHEIPRPLRDEDRVAFSLKNLTGQRIRIHQQSDLSTDSSMGKPVVVSYLNQGESMGLTFAATISVVKNLRIAEVPYPGFSNSKTISKNQGSLNHAIDIQVPGCRWIQGVTVDTFGRRFESLTPRSAHVLAKIFRDWRLRNAMMLLTEVGQDNGGRSVTVRSLFELNNNTTHPIKVVFNPDPRYRPDVASLREEKENSKDTLEDPDGAYTKSAEFTVIGPGGSLELPTLLIENALEMEGSHLGSFWICPDTDNHNFSFKDFTLSTGFFKEEIEASFCTRPVQLAKIVHESSVIFQSAPVDEDVAPSDAKSGVQISCPTRSSEGDSKAPFCYALEVSRSPLVGFDRDKTIVDIKTFNLESTENKMIESHKQSKREKKTKRAERIHGPVSYSLSVHAPLVIANLLPEGGRFELMHAVRKTVVWFADLQPGQQVPVHSIGLDAPLLLLVNLGFCRTPVGEGALVHHGGDAVCNGKEQGVRFKTIGKAVTKGTKQIGKTLTNLADSPDKRVRIRAEKRLAKIQTPQFYDRSARKGNVKDIAPTSNENSMGLDTDSNEKQVAGKIHSMETISYSAADVANETVVVDGIGQRLTLNIENIRGGGGQRRVSLYSPFWIVNTTEHALRYRQDKGKNYVCGTVLGPEKDGSVPVDGSNRNYRARHKLQQSTRRMAASQSLLDDNATSVHKRPMNQQTIFAGTFGALATAPGKCELGAKNLAALIDHEMSLDKLSDLAFMFNFPEDVIGTGNQMFSLQLYDGTGQTNYVSEWSRSFSLESVGFSQIVGLPCKDGRLLEISATVNVAPGMLSGYTKIVRFYPRYVVFNRLERPIRLWQDSSIVRTVSEDRASASDMMEVVKESRKWRYLFEDKYFEGKINQYESLFGRPSTLDDRVELLFGQHSRRVQPIPEGTVAHRSAFYIASVGPSELVPFVLPDSRAERQLRIDFGGLWNLTASFASDFPGEYNLTASRTTDLRMLNHVATRAAPKYKIILPPPDESGLGFWDGELGVFFETEWGSKTERKIVVKGTKRGKYAFNHTDIHVGDELLRIDGVSVLKMTFAEAMKIIKDRLAEIQAYKAQENDGAGQAKRGIRRMSFGVAHVLKKPHEADASMRKPTSLALTFRTQEERLRKLRVKAGKGPGSLSMTFHSTKSTGMKAVEGADESLSPYGSSFDIDGVNVEMKSLHNTMFVILRDVDQQNPMYRIQNRSMNHVVLYRQRHCEGHEWNVLLPGESLPYCWEEPMKSKKLTVRLAVKSICHPEKDDGVLAEEVLSDIESYVLSNEFLDRVEEKKAARTARLSQMLAYQYVDNEERSGFGQSITVRLEEIGFQSLIPLPATEIGKTKTNFLSCEVDTDGGTRLLIISDEISSSNESHAINRNIDILTKQVTIEDERLAGLQSLRHILSQAMQKEISPGVRSQDSGAREIALDNERLSGIQEELRKIVDDFPEENTVTGCHQVVVEVLEAVGLSSSDFIGSCNPYCEVMVKGRSRSRRHFMQRRRNQRKTYFVEKSLNPKWLEQSFVFEVPEDAVRVTRGHSIQIKVRNFRLVGQHPILGQAAVHFASLRHQQELIGWYPLSSKAGKSDMAMSADQVMSDLRRGSIKLRVQWIYTLPALVDYFILLSQRRLNDMTTTKDGMADQLKFAISSDERKQEADEHLPGGQITKLVKIQKKAAKRAAKRDGKKRDRQLAAIKAKKPKRNSEQEKTDSNASVASVKQTLKATRNRYLYALHFQTAESKRSRHSEAESAGEICSEPSSSMKGNALSKISEQKSVASNSSSKQNVAQEMIERERQMHSDSPGNATTSLDAFFSKQKSPSCPRTTPRKPTSRTLTPSKATKRSLMETEAGRRIQSYRRLSEDLDGYLPDGGGDSDPWTPTLLRGQAIYDDIKEQLPDLGISDLMSVGTDLDEAAKRRRNVMDLMSKGYVFHQEGENWVHQVHLSNHFRRSLFASTIDNQKISRLYISKFFVGTSSSIKQFKNWQNASALFWNPEIDVVVTNDSFLIGLKRKMPQMFQEPPLMNVGKTVIAQKLSVPKEAPMGTFQRSKYRIETMHLFHFQFERAVRRILGSTLHYGGFLTIRPTAALNLPDTYTGMYVKMVYGSQVRTTETVDAKVSPRWVPQNFEHNHDHQSATRGAVNSRKKSACVPNPLTPGFKFSENDLHLQVEPQQTSGSIRISILAERMNSKVELGVIHIPLGAAIAACIDAAQDLDNSECDIQGVPAYTRWFPLTEPRLALPVEGDMGLSSRPTECEQRRDNAFSQYFAPCIQLSLIWWPEDQSQHGGRQSDTDTQASAFRTSLEAERILRIPPIQQYLNIDINRVTAALVDSQRAVELLNLSLVEIDVRYAVTRTKTRVGMIIGWIQLDHQDNRSREPVVLAPTPAEHLQPTLQFLALKDNLRTKSNILSFEYIGVALQEMDFTVEESWIFELWDFLMSVTRKHKAKKRTLKGQRHADAVSRNENIFAAVDEQESVKPSLFSALQAAGERSETAEKKKVYVEHLILGLMKVNLSYVKGKKQSFDLDDQGSRALRTMELKDIQNFALAAGGIQFGSMSKSEQSEVFTKWSQMTFEDDSIHESGGVHNLPGIIAAVFPSVSDAPIRLQGKAIDHVFESPKEIFSSVKNYYVNETLKQVYKIIGSLDFVGNPTILFSSFVSGVRDLVVAPAAAFRKSPTNVRKVGIGVGKGTLSLFSHSASGIFGFSARLWASAGQVVAILSLDAEYRQWHRDRIVNEATNLNRVWKRRGMQSAQEVLLRPIADVVLGITMGTTGFITAPYKGAKKGGIRGFINGVAVGTIGVVAKPVVGVFDAFTHASQTVHDFAKSVNVLERRYQPALKLRLPYIFGPMNILTPFDTVSARSIHLLALFPPRTKLKRRIHKGKEVHVHSEVLNMEPGVETFAIATTIRVVLIKLRRDNNNALAPSFGWEVDLSSSDIVSSTVSDHGHNGVALTITKRAPNKQMYKDKKKSVKKQRQAQQQTEKSMRSHASSAASVESSAYSDGEEELEIDIGNDDASQEGILLSIDDSKPSLAGTAAVAAESTEYHHGATTKHGEVLEWFTVLAEFQHRKQLTRLHNAISCIVGDYDAVIVDRLMHSGKKEGTFTFGIFNFESGLPDSRTAQVSNMELVGDLEYLPWMQQSLFERVRMLPANRRKDYLSRIRRTWGYSKDLEASVAIGGPAWLIEARARAIHISQEQQASAACGKTSASFEVDNDAILEVLHEEMDAGTVNSDIAMSLMKRIAAKDEEAGSSTIELSRPHDLSDDVDDSSTDMVETTIPPKHSLSIRTVNDSSKESIPSLPVRNLRTHFHKDSDGDIFFSMRNLSGGDAHDIDQSNDYTLDTRGGESEIMTDISDSYHARDRKKPPVTQSQLQEAMATRESNCPPSPSVVPPEQEQIHHEMSKDSTYFGSVKSHSLESEEYMSGNAAAAEAAAAHKHEVHVKFTASAKQHKGHVSAATGGRSFHSMDVSESSDATSRMDRLEAVMEQLVLLNASQLQQQQQQQRGTNGLDQSHHSHSSATSAVYEIADTLKNELAEIRSQIKSRAKEDEALRSEITMLRSQLEDRRNKANDERKKNKKEHWVSPSAQKRKKFPVPEIRLKTMLPRRLLHDDKDSGKAHAGGAAAASTKRPPIMKKESNDSKSLSSNDGGGRVGTDKATNDESRNVGWDD